MRRISIIMLLLLCPRAILYSKQFLSTFHYIHDSCFYFAFFCFFFSLSVLCFILPLPFIVFENGSERIQWKMSFIMILFLSHSHRYSHSSSFNVYFSYRLFLFVQNSQFFFAFFCSYIGKYFLTTKSYEGGHKKIAAMWIYLFNTTRREEKNWEGFFFSFCY